MKSLLIIFLISLLLAALCTIILGIIYLLQSPEALICLLAFLTGLLTLIALRPGRL